MLRLALLFAATLCLTGGAAAFDAGKYRIVSARNIAGLENLKSLDKLPPAGFTVIALPMKIEGGSGGPARVVAVVPR